MSVAPEVSVDSYLSRRQYRRFEVEEPATFEVKGRIYHCTIIDVSAGGAGLTISPKVQLPERQGVLTCQRFGAFVCNIRYQSRERFGVQFVQDQSAEADLDLKLGELLGEASTPAD